MWEAVFCFVGQMLLELQFIDSTEVQQVHKEKTALKSLAVFLQRRDGHDAGCIHAQRGLLVKCEYPASVRPYVDRPGPRRPPGKYGISVFVPGRKVFPGGFQV